MRLLIPPPVQGSIAALLMWVIAAFLPAFTAPFQSSGLFAGIVVATGLATCRNFHVFKGAHDRKSNQAGADQHPCC